MGGSKVFSFADRNNSQLKIFSTTSERLKIKRPRKSKTFACSFLFFRHFGWPGRLSSGQHHLAKNQKQSHFPHHRQPCQATPGRSKSTWQQHKLPTNRSSDKQTSPETTRPVQRQTERKCSGLSRNSCEVPQQSLSQQQRSRHDAVCKSFRQTICTLPCERTSWRCL